ncbi:NAE1 isoform 5 [Pan troglodytes]|uniref:NEDD8 activating enzyme E1 subunit 1 n=2 Tax=Homininae TaxID=207598 RepID=H3BS69_HUMAN|nr:NEDD8 activating enzyme E1 subunit 1 [Homo sapiens]KAI4055413.1 NEDD8 activating enzyme E1 subunit 1 [Homo sapiens]PNI63427.1 NAE1 isoform 5 [Pan troglodytes]
MAQLGKLLKEQKYDRQLRRFLHTFDSCLGPYGAYSGVERWMLSKQKQMKPGTVACACSPSNSRG